MTLMTLTRLPKTILCLILTGVGLVLLLAVVGHLLIVDDPLEPAEAILVLAARGARAREAAALYQRGLAPRIVLAPARGRHDEQARVLLSAGVPETAVVRLPRPTGNTHDELLAGFEYAREQGFRRVILVTSPYHTRRVSLIWRQIARERVAAVVRATPHERFDPNFWWASHRELRAGLHELGGIAFALIRGALRV